MMSRVSRSVGVATAFVYALASVATIGATILAIQNVALGLGGVIGMAVAILVLRKPWLTLPLTVIAAFAIMPNGMPRTLGVGGFNAFFWEIFLAAALVFVLLARPARRSSDFSGLVLFSVGAIWLITGLAMGNAVSPAINDARGLMTGAMAVVVAGRIIGFPEFQKTVTVFKWVLWYSAAAVLAGQLGIFDIQGTSEDAGLTLGSGTRAESGAERFITSATHAGLVVICVCLALTITRRRRIGAALPFLLPAVVIVFVSFSRNSLLAIGIAIIYAILTDLRFRTMLRGPVIVGAGVACAGAVYALASLSGQSGPLGFLSTQIDAYVSRVFVGLDPSVIAVDSSAQYRANESVMLQDAWSQSFIWGNGMGHAFRPSSGVEGSFTAGAGMYYGHNFYLWLGVKAGLVGLAILIFLFARPLLRRLTDAPDAVAGASAALAALLGISFVAPMLLSSISAGCLLVGAMLGVACSWGRVVESRVRRDARRVSRRKLAPVV
jgi:hypothetical protein